MSNSKSGFYYDIQKNDPITSMSLHCNVNMEMKNGKKVISNEEKDTDGYFKENICTSILNEDFQVAINNAWSDFGGDPIGSMWEKMMPWSPILSSVADQLPGLMKEAGEMLTDVFDEFNFNPSEVFGKIKSNSPMLSKFSDKIGEMTKQAKELGLNAPQIASDLLTRPLIVQSTRYSYYAGTGTTFGNLGMKFTIFADWKLENGKYVWKTVHDQLSRLYPYIMGKYSNLSETASEVGLNITTELDEFVGWQKPPGGFNPDVKYLDRKQEGTLKLKLGSYYSLPNLVVADSNLNYSKQMVKCPTAIATDNFEDWISPLFCEVTLLLKPAAKYTDITLEDIISGKSMKKERKETSLTMKKRLEEEKSKWKNSTSSIDSKLS